jgi:hypothetical protein
MNGSIVPIPAGRYREYMKAGLVAPPWLRVVPPRAPHFIARRFIIDKGLGAGDFGQVPNDYE